MELGAEALSFLKILDKISAYVFYLLGMRDEELRVLGHRISNRHSFTVINSRGNKLESVFKFTIAVSERRSGVRRCVCVGVCCFKEKNKPPRAESPLEPRAPYSLPRKTLYRSITMAKLIVSTNPNYEKASRRSVVSIWKRRYFSV